MKPTVSSTKIRFRVGSSFEVWEVPRGFGADYLWRIKEQFKELAEGHSGEVIHALIGLLELAGYSVTSATVASWSLRQRIEAEAWAANAILRASDNPIRRHPELDWLPNAWKGPPHGTGVWDGPGPTAI